jgi:transcriptional regulator with XRE-family HTH domain
LKEGEYMTLGEKIDREIKKKGLKQNEVAKSSKISPSYLSYLINGKSTNPTAPTLGRLAKALGVPIENLVKYCVDKKGVVNQ